MEYTIQIVQLLIYPIPIKKLFCNLMTKPAEAIYIGLVIQQMIQIFSYAVQLIICEFFPAPPKLL